MSHEEQHGRHPSLENLTMNPVEKNLNNEFSQMTMQARRQQDQYMGSFRQINPLSESMSNSSSVVTPSKQREVILKTVKVNSTKKN
jgi:hypothetical protein